MSPIIVVCMDRSLTVALSGSIYSYHPARWIMAVESTWWSAFHKKKAVAAGSGEKKILLNREWTSSCYKQGLSAYACLAAQIGIWKASLFLPLLRNHFVHICPRLWILAPPLKQTTAAVVQLRILVVEWCCYTTHARTLLGNLYLVKYYTAFIGWMIFFIFSST